MDGKRAADEAEILDALRGRMEDGGTWRGTLLFGALVLISPPGSSPLPSDGVLFKTRRPWSLDTDPFPQQDTAAFKINVL